MPASQKVPLHRIQMLGNGRITHFVNGEKVLVFQDGQRATNPNGSLRVPQVMENLIHKDEMPASR